MLLKNSWAILGNLPAPAARDRREYFGELQLNIRISPASVPARRQKYSPDFPFYRSFAGNPNSDWLLRNAQVFSGAPNPRRLRAVWGGRCGGRTAERKAPNSLDSIACRTLRMVSRQ